ncbi:MAG: preprotein translocase subunit SecG [Salinibacter sp.]
MFTFMVVLVALIAAVLILVILLQSGQGGGLSGIAQGGPARQVLGTRQAPDTLEKATWTLGTIFITLCVVMNFFVGTEEQGSIIQDRARQGQTEQQQPQAPGSEEDAAPLPQGGGEQGSGQGGEQQSGGSGGN